jgi:hypothetical protein
MELRTIVDFTRTNPSIDPAAFPGTPAEWFWTSSPYAGQYGYAWGVSFFNGFPYILDNTGTLSDLTGPAGVRCVR